MCCLEVVLSCLVSSFCLVLASLAWAWLALDCFAWLGLAWLGLARPVFTCLVYSSLGLSCLVFLLVSSSHVFILVLSRLRC